MSRLRSHLSYANVMATIAVFLGLGGTSYAALTITGNNVRDGSLTGKDIKNSSVATADVKNSSLLSKDFKAGQLPTGAQGEQGGQGAQGLQGGQGAQGLEGSNGDTGATGGKGDPGVAGAAGDMLPAGAVSFFDLAACPSGWSELTAARGRYVVGLPSGGTLNGTAGTPLSNGENRPVGQHGHEITDWGHAHGYSFTGSWSDGSGNMIELGAGSITRGYSGTTDRSNTGISVNNAGAVAGTNAPYLQLLACKKG